MFHRALRHSSHRSVCELLERRRLLNAGDLDTSFSGDGKTGVEIPNLGYLGTSDVAVQSGGKVIVAGQDPKKISVRVARLNSDGSLDLTFGSFGVPGLSMYSLTQGAVVAAVAVQPLDNAIVVVGTVFREALTPSGCWVTRFTANGMHDQSFNDGIGHAFLYWFNSAADVAIQNDGKIVVAGTELDGADTDMGVARFNTDGTLDHSFAGDGTANIGFGEDEETDGLTIDYTGSPGTNPNYGKILVVGSKSSSDAGTEMAVARLDSNGSPDSSFDGDGKRSMRFRAEYEYSEASSVVVQPGGKIVVAATVGFGPSSTWNFGLMRLNANGSDDSSFGVSLGRTEIDFDSGRNQVSDLIIGQSGGLIVGGLRSPYGDGANAIAIAYFSSEGILDPVFSGDGKQTILTYGPDFSAGGGGGLALTPGGTFVAVGGNTIARLFDRKAVTVSIGSFQPNGSESGPSATGFVVARLQSLPTPQRVFLSIGGTARAPYLFNADYTASGMTINHPIQGPTYVDIPANQGFVAVTITPVDDALVEGDETAIFSISASGEYDIGTPPSTTLAIRDNDAVGPPVVVSSSFEYDSGLPQYVRLTFNRDVASSIGANDFSVTGPLGAVPFSFSHDDITNTSTLSFSGILPDGNYTATAIAAGITNSDGTAMAANYSFPFFVLAGDANRDRRVDIVDLAVLASYWQGSPSRFSQGDFNYDGVVDISDLAILATNWQVSLAPPAPVRMARGVGGAFSRNLLAELN